MMRTAFLAAAALVSLFAFGCSGTTSSSSGSSGTSGTSGTSGGETPATGNVPAELVAVWKGTEETLELRADGTAGRAMRGGSTCTYESIENGIASADGTTLTLTFTSGTFKDCTGSDARFVAKTETFAYVLESDGAVLKLTADTCATGACTNGYDKH